jgi:hypothetical protein
MAQRLVEACPDMRQMAREIARQTLITRTGTDLEPDRVYWHRFHTAVSSHLSFNGWQHFDPPMESMTLPQLVMRRFNAADQDNADSLQMMSGFYTADATADRYNESNEVRLLPIDVMEDFWAVDFSTRYHTRLSAFWRDCSDDFRTLAKTNFLTRALDDRESGDITDSDLRTLLQVAGNVQVPIQLSTLRAPTLPPAGLRITAFDIAGYEASDILRIVTPTGRQLLYVPGETVSFHGFTDDQALQAWLLEETATVEGRAGLLAHFPLSMRQENAPDVGLNHLMDLMHGASRPDLSLLNRNNRTLEIDPFTWLRDSARTRMNADAHLCLRSNADLRKQMWIGYLNAFSHVMGPLAAIDWPIALVVVGAGLADMGLNIDQAVNGPTTAERKQGVIGAIVSGIDVLFNSLFLLQAGSAPLESPVPEAQLPALSPAPPAVSLEPPAVSLEPPAVSPEPTESTPLLSTTPTSPAALDSGAVPVVEQLHAFESNFLLEGFTPGQEPGRMRGIYQMPNGDTYIQINGRSYQVRYVNELSYWVIIDPRNPFSFYEYLPVHLDAQDQWQVVDRRGLLGGGPTASTLQRARARDTSLESVLSFSDYDVPSTLKPNVAGAVNGNDLAVLRGELAGTSPGWRDPYIEFRGIRARLAHHAQNFYRRLTLPLRPQIPQPAIATTYKTTLKRLFANSTGLVIGESHASIGSKKFLIDNMRVLTKLKVKTLYMEHLLTDFHQMDLNEFRRTGRMPQNLERYLNNLDRGFQTDARGQYTFLALVKAANANLIRIRAIDCLASYRLDGLADPDGNLRQKIMNYFARTIIRADGPARAEGEKWVALVGNTHANTYKGVAGLSELESAVGLRIEDIDVQQPETFASDPGQELEGPIGSPGGFVKSDLRLQLKVIRSPSTLSAEDRLVLAGMFIIDDSPGNSVLIHRAADDTIARTAIRSRFGKVYINRPSWPAVSGRRFNSLGDLAAALKLMGMTDVS